MRRAGKAHAYAMVADQTPLRPLRQALDALPEPGHGVLRGRGQDHASFLEAPVVYVAMRRVARGRYPRAPGRAGGAAVRPRRRSCR